ncbi:sugar phosphate isomerase/epimerase family protein [Arenibacter sp. GZD96]|uniref:sugar phosphate isomerase/epimerase family protein n=1 Tax=Aurantibrevibacter litoralis TaxID=3106030 RepID=UPI002AFF9458|nr:sugar phosphate isomerase/epimerase family protein [Arenibacter sp. GZD-96]MEA1786601.1 sugar phosphate isomerase/epimerase family protein [Arenibacter sp. GZD-96]
MQRRKFITHSSQLGIAVSLMGLYACKVTKKHESELVAPSETDMVKEPFFKLSLAQWSIHNMIWEGRDPYTFAELAKNWGFSGLEYVSQLYDKELEPLGYSEEAMAAFVEKSNAEAKKHGLQNVLIMIDGQGDLATVDTKERNKAVENHYKWVDAAAKMGCHAIRVNLSGSNVPDEWKASAVDGLTQLATYAKDKQINITVENHGGLSSNAEMLAAVMDAVGMDNCGTLPDFGNFCIRRNDPADWASGCAEKYDIYKGVKELMVHAKAVSAKSHDFDAEGNETEIDYVKMLQIVKDAGYTGYIGVEYEGSDLDEEAGILATKNLMLKAAAALS